MAPCTCPGTLRHWWRGRCATRHIRDVIALPPSVARSLTSLFPLILAPSRLSLLLRHLTASLSLSFPCALCIPSLAPVVPKLIPWNNWTPGNEPRIQHGQTGVASWRVRHLKIHVFQDAKLKWISLARRCHQFHAYDTSSTTLCPNRIRRAPNVPGCSRAPRSTAAETILNVQSRL